MPNCYLCAAPSFKASETLLGIETFTGCGLNLLRSSFKASETLLGIETWRSQAERLSTSTASKPLKPF